MSISTMSMILTVFGMIMGRSESAIRGSIMCKNDPLGQMFTIYRTMRRDGGAIRYEF